MEVSSYDYFTPALLDCWDYVLEHITEPEDVNSLILSCPLFAEMLHARKMIELFLPVLLRKTALPRDTLLSLRLLNKGTRHTVDNFFSDIAFDDEDDIDDDYHWLQKASHLHPDRPERLQRFKSLYAPQVLSGTLISSRLRIGAPRDRLLEPMRTFLQPIGHLVKILQMELYCSENDYPAYFHLVRLLEQLPVISSLSLQFDAWSPLNRQASFPPLPFLTELKLKSLERFGIHDDRKRLIELMIQSYGAQLKLLSLRFYAALDYNLSNSNLSKLECLEMGDFSRHSEQYLVYDLPKIRLSSLKTLVVTGQFFKIWVYFLNALGHLWSTLEELQIRAEVHISGFKMSFTNDPSLWMRALPKLRRVVADARDWDSVVWPLFCVVFSNMEELKFEEKFFSPDYDEDDSNDPRPQRSRGMLRKFFLLFPKLKQIVWVGSEEKCGSGAKEQFVVKRSGVKNVWLSSSVKEQPSAEGGDGEAKDDKTFPDGNKALETEGNGFQLELVLPIILKMKKLPFEDVLTCRLVCGKWQQGVDSVLQNHPSRLNPPEESRAFTLRRSRTAVDQLHSSERLFGDFGMRTWGSWFYFLSDHRVNWTKDRGFVDQILSHPKNPFVGRSLHLRTNHWADYCDLGHSLLKRFGKEVWYFCYRIDDSESFRECPVEKRIRDALIHLPNLKWLQLDVALPQDENESTVDTRGRHYFRQYPLPQLQHLETFACDGLFKTPKIILTSILESCCLPEKLKRLSLPNSQLKYQPTFIFPNLEELGVKMDLKNLASLKKNSPHLKKLSLILSNPAEDGTSQGIDGGELFGLLEAFQETLEDLGMGREFPEVDCDCPREEFDCDCPREKLKISFPKAEFKIYLPELELLELDFDIPVESLEDLRRLKQLWLHSYCDEEQVEDYKVNIGRLLPSLKTFECSGAKSKVKMRRDVTSGLLVVDNIEKYLMLGDSDVEEEESRSNLSNRLWIWVMMLSFLIILGGGFLSYKYGGVMTQLEEWYMFMIHEVFKTIFRV